MKEDNEFLRKTIGFWRRLDTIGSILLLVVLACLVISFVGIPKGLNETVDARVYTEFGEVIPCQVLIKGEVTHYPFRNTADYSISAYRDHILISEMTYNTKKQQYGTCQTYRFTGIKDIAQDVLFVEMDLQTLFPEMGSQRCIIAAPGRQMESIIRILDQEEIPKNIKEAFDWFIPE